MTVHLGQHTYRDEELLVVAHLAEHARHPPGTVTHEWPCRECHRMMLIDDRSLGLVEQGRPIACLGCAIDCYPDMVCYAVSNPSCLLTLGDAVRLGLIHRPEPAKEEEP